MEKRPFPPVSVLSSLSDAPSSLTGVYSAASSVRSQLLSDLGDVGAGLVVLIMEIEPRKQGQFLTKFVESLY